MVVEGTRRAALAALKVWKVALAKEGRKMSVAEAGARWNTWVKSSVTTVLVTAIRDGSKEGVRGLDGSLEEDSLEVGGGV